MILMVVVERLSEDLVVVLRLPKDVDWLPEAKDETVALLGHMDDPMVVPKVEGDLWSFQ